MKCKSCSKICERFPLMLFCQTPQSYDDLSDDFKMKKAKLSSDLCSIDNSKYFVRSLLEIPIFHSHLPQSFENDLNNINNNFNYHISDNDDNNSNINNNLNNKTNKNLNNNNNNNIINDKNNNFNNRLNNLNDNYFYFNDYENNNNNNLNNNNNNLKNKKRDCGCKLTFGVWVQISANDFQELITTWDEEDEKIYKGKINNNLSLFNCIDLPVTFTTRKKLRPLIIKIHDEDHPLSIEQKEGISLPRAELLLSQLLK